MANNRINRYFGAIALGAVLTAVPGCTDTWDDHYNGESTSGASQTLWEKISSNPNYSRFADIVSKAKYYKDNTHPVDGYTYKDILSGGQVNTVWAPDNTALTEAEYQKWVEMLESDEVVDGYNVQQQFLGNHIALWRHNISEPGVDTVKMINGKNLTFDKGKRTLEGLALTEYNIAAGNGVMHIIDGVVPFRYNFYEDLKFSKPQTKFGEYVVGQDTTYFFREASIEGLPDENGRPTYVDSVYRTSNMLFETQYYIKDETWVMAKEGFSARINNEDSAFVMIMPSDAAWTAAYDMLKPAYTYATVYDDKSKGDLGSSTALPAKGKLDPDSIQKMSIEMDMISPLVYNIHKQPKRGGTEMWTLEMFKQYKGDTGSDPKNPDNYVLNTFGDTLRAIGDWKPSDLFEGELKEMSNGLGYVVPSWNFPSQFYAPDVEVEIENTGIFYNMNSNSSKYKGGPGSKRYTFSNTTYKDVTQLYGEVSNNNFYHLDAPGPTATPRVEIKLTGNSASAYVPNAEVMSGKYDIQLVVVPHWYLDIAQASEIDDKFYVKNEIINPEDETDIQYEVTDEIDTEYIEQLASQNKYKFKVTLSYNNNAAKDKTLASKNIEYNGLKVDTLTVLENFEFPYSYKNLIGTYPTLLLEGTTTKSDANPKVTAANPNPPRFVFDLVIDKIILKRKN